MGFLFVIFEFRITVVPLYPEKIAAVNVILNPYSVLSCLPLGSKLEKIISSVALENYEIVNIVGYGLFGLAKSPLIPNCFILQMPPRPIPHHISVSFVV